MKKKNVAGIIVLCLATIVSIAFCFYAKDTVNNNITSQKEIIITVINGNDEKVFNISTDGETLSDAAAEINLVEGEMGQYGLYIKSVNGYTANEEKQEWWCITKNTEPVFEGIDNIKIADGEKYEITLKTGY